MSYSLFLKAVSFFLWEFFAAVVSASILRILASGKSLESSASTLWVPKPEYLIFSALHSLHAAVKGSE